MSPNKRKILASDKSDEDDSFKHRRSSLRVNLSYSMNLTDSGNGSLWRTELESNERETDAVQTRGRLSRRKSTHEKDHRSDLDNEDTQAVGDTSKCAVNNDDEIPARVKEGIQLKRLTINLEDISTKERYLEASCKHLKDAILYKTKEIFHKENELSIKTAIVLGNENHFASTNNPNNGNKSIILDTTNRHLREEAAEEHELTEYTLGNRQREYPCSNIVATPTNSDGRRSLERNMDKSRLTQRRLFIEKDKPVKGQMKCRIIKDVILKKSFSLLSLRQADQSGSPILSGSNRRLSLLKAQSRLRSQNQPESQNNTYSTVHSVRNIDIGAPIVCSTFIEDNAMDEREGSSDMDVSRATHTTNKVMSMEITEIHGGIRMSEEQMSLQNRNSNTNNENSKEERSKGGSTERKQNAVTPRLEDAEHPANKVTIQNNIPHSDLSCTNDVNDQDMASMYIDTVIPMQTSIEEVAVVTKTRDILQAYKCGNKTKHQSEKRLSLSDSNNTIRSSLNVNTSLDAMTEASKARDVRKANDYKTNDANQDYEATINNKESIALNEHESANTIRTSLQMNTSVDSMRKTWQRESDSLSKRSLVQDKDDKHRISSSTNKEYSTETENKIKHNIDFLENMSLIERLRNISMRNQVSHNDKSRAFKMRDEDIRRASNSGDSYSYVEGTPYPISRSVLFKSQLKHKTQNLDDAASCSSNLNSMSNEKNNDKSVALHPNEMHVSTKTQKTTEADTFILVDTPSDDPFVTQNQLMIMKDKPDGTEPETDEKNTAASQNMECVPVRKGRRRLLPLHESSQLCSISPVDEKRCTPEKSTSAKRNKRLKKRPKRKSIRSRNNINNVKRGTISEQTWSDSDCDIPKNNRKESKKTRKPRKVVSKKIRIKKFAEENVLNILQGNKQDKADHSTENGDSFDDFVKCRTISTQWNKHRSQKIVIVTTGLSNGDKSLVKSIVNSLGAAEMELNVSRRTTHVVSTGVRTMNLLRGIIRGCWLITLEWVLKSLENKAWLDPETFEMKHFSKAVQENRKDRQLFGPSYIPELFTTCGFIYVGCKTTVPCDTLKELIKTAGGHITENTKLAKIIIGPNGLRETWVIDSITTGELQLTKLYQRK